MPENSIAGVEKNVTSGDGDRLAATQQENRLPRQASRRSRGVTVSEAIIRPLKEAHERLEGYIKGFVLFRDLGIESVGIRTTLQDAARWADPWPLLDEVRSGLEDIQADFLMREIWKSEFMQQLDGFAGALEGAQTFLNGVYEPLYEQPLPEKQATLAGMHGPINGMITNAKSIEGLCRNRCQDEVDELGRYVKNIFDQLERKPVGETSSVNKAGGRLVAPQPEETNPAVVDFARRVTEQTNEETSVAGRPRRETANGR